MAPESTNTAPTISCQVIFSFKKMIDSKIANTKEDRSMVITLVAGPCDNALNENSVDKVVAIPANTSSSHVLFSISFKEENLPWYSIIVQVMLKISTA